MLKDEEKRRIAEILNQRVGHFVCPPCHKGRSSLVDGYSSNTLGDSYHAVTIGGTIMPYVMLVCDNCGFISHHALGTLALLNREKEASGDTRQ